MPFFPNSFHVRTIKDGPDVPDFVGPLDDQTAGLGGAWSVKRRLLSTYMGALFRGRRSSDGEELDIGFLSNGKVDAAAFLAFVGSDTAYIVVIYDQSGNGRDRVQAVMDDQPMITMTGDGSDAVVTTTASTSLTISSFNPQLMVGTNAGVIVANLKPTGGDGRPLSGAGNATLNIWAPNSNTIYFDYGGFTSGRNSVGVPVGWANNWHWLRCQRVGTTQGIYVDSVELQSSTLSATIDGTPQGIYLPQDFRGQMGDVACWTDGNNADAREAALMA